MTSTQALSGATARGKGFLADFLLLYHLVRRLGRDQRTALVKLALLQVLGAAADILGLAAVGPMVTSFTAGRDVPGMAYLSALFPAIAADQRLTIIFFGSAFCVMLALSSLIKLLILRMQQQITARMANSMSVDVYRKTLRQDYIYHKVNNSSNLISTLTVDLGTAAGAISAFFYLCTSTFVVMTTTVAVFFFNPLVTLTVGTFILSMYFLISYLTRATLRRNGQITSDGSREMLRVIRESLSGIKSIILGGTHGVFESRFRAVDLDIKLAGASSGFIRMAPRHAIEIAAVCALGVYLIVASLLTDDHAQTLTAIGILSVASVRLLPAFQQCYASWSGIAGARASMERVMIALSLIPVEISPASGNDATAPFTESVRLDGISYKYAQAADGEDAGAFALVDINVTLKPNSVTAFVGRSGSGKTTSVDLLMGLLVPDRGCIRLDDRPVTDLAAWRGRVAHVPQEIFLTSGTIAENVAFGIAPEAIDFAKVTQSVRMASLLDVVEAWEGGIHAHVGENGSRLSQGQRQRIGIARALYKDADVLVFDEATSSLDGYHERIILENIHEIARFKTVILITHRKETLWVADYIYMFMGGRVVGEGTYAELMESSRDFEMQFEGTRDGAPTRPSINAGKPQ
ncbi:MAG: ABC transporter ATP-binding protein [Rhodospirillales bacterium]